MGPELRQTRELEEEWASLCIADLASTLYRNTQHSTARLKMPITMRWIENMNLFHPLDSERNTIHGIRLCWIPLKQDIRFHFELTCSLARFATPRPSSRVWVYGLFLAQYSASDPLKHTTYTVHTPRRVTRTVYTWLESISTSISTRNLNFGHNTFHIVPVFDH